MEKITSKFEETMPEGPNTFSDVISSANVNLEHKFNHVLHDSVRAMSDFASESKDQLTAKGKRMSKTVSQNIRAQPWAYLAGASILGTAFTMYMRRSKN